MVLRPRVNLVRYDGVFAPNSPHRAAVTPARRGCKRPDAQPDKTPAQQCVAMSVKPSDSNASSTSISKLARLVADTSRSSPASKTPLSSGTFSTISTGAQRRPRTPKRTPSGRHPNSPCRGSKTEPQNHFKHGCQASPATVAGTLGFDVASPPSATVSRSLNA